MSVLRAAARRSLAIVGLAPASHVSGLSDRVARGERRAAELTRATEQARAEAAELKDRLRELKDQLLKSQEAARHATEKAGVWQARDRRNLERLRDAQKAIGLSQEHMMAMETKFDIIEAAVAVLDTRTRDWPAP